MHDASIAELSEKPKSEENSDGIHRNTTFIDRN